MKTIVKKREILKFSNGQLMDAEDTIVTEFPVTVKINEQEFVTMVCTPEYIEDMVIGYLASEGIIRKYEDIKDIWIQEKEGYAHVKIDKLNPYYQNLQNKRYITSCCGMSRQGFVFANDALTAKKMNDIRVTISPDECFRLMNNMQNSATIFHETGGVHNAALCDKNGFLLSRMDIGRHNALDKIYGYCLKNNILIEDKIIVFSGRISSEILLKVAKIGCEIVLSKSAPTELALNLAEELGITTVGFIRNQSLNIYSCPKRICSNSKKL
ncbi:formate dehydrogenase accessory sulfurtransferase FdhD [Peribacillus asahii]|uniref:formate dehydrogenase accessory sulfurtransferase FdhD n=1 Tax=Peribacillus asahii TaxID=228899 RepID=UPI00207968B1|nr:formate dehydrogenase accessory sulfurtransferase FdhD [Peribacillus asahii]USK84549.1 formate dehydrogenase accessory sulfurtransferase FdhD [Peribacillus asahii]